MALPTGTRLGPYAVTAQIGVGGMGEVYKATDTNLKRAVAIKVLPTSVASDAERLARFQREAEVLAALNHPNIAAIYGLERSAGITALVMELVEGPTLADRIARGAIPIDEALPIAKQIAEALEAAHEQGIIHRDLKPANVKVRPDGTVKVLDFGLAKAMEPAGAPSPNASISPTITSPAMMTGVGVVLGTAAYMGPEQARGRRVDHRADVWAFGCVLFEMLTGRRAFGGETVTETLAAVLERQPDWQALPGSTPSDIRRLLQRCLAKEPKNRLHAIADVRLVLEDARHDGTTVASANINRRVVWAAVALGCAASLAAGWLLGSRPPASAPLDVSRWLVDVRPATALLGALPGSEYARFRPSRTAVALSPNGRTIAFTAQRDGTTRLYIRALDRMDASVITGTDGAEGPFFSPDGTWVGFWANGAIRKVPLTGGPPVKVSDTDPPAGATWASDDTIVFANAAAIWEVGSSGGTPRALTKVAQGEFRRVLPARLPGRWLLFTVLPATFDWERSRVVAQSLDTGEQRVLLEGATDARYVPTGHLVFMRLGNLMAAPFDAEGARLTGPEVGVIERIMQSVNTGGVPTDTGAGQYTFSSTGTLAYVAGELIPDFEGTFHWIGRDGSIEPISAQPKPYQTPRLSPDGRYVVASTWGLRDRNLWRYDFDTGNLTRLTTEGRAQFPAWSRDGTVLFSLGLTGPPNVFTVRADGGGAPTRLAHSENVQFPGTSTPDGRTVVWAEGATVANLDIKAISIGEPAARPILATRFSEFNPELSPDGRWLAYVSNETGRNEVYAGAFPDLGGKRTISRTGGDSPAWSLDRRKLFYLSPSSKPGESARQLMEMDVTLDPTFTATLPRPLFEPMFESDLVRTYDLTRNADRFIFLRVRHPPATSAPREIHVVQNWSEELKRLVPTN